MSGPERRKSERVGLRIPVDYSAVDAFFTEFTHNVNEGGMFVEVEEGALSEIDTPVELELRLPGLKDPVQVTGRVAWTSDGKDDSPRGIGIEFTDLSETVRAQINKVVRYLRV